MTTKALEDEIMSDATASAAPQPIPETATLSKPKKSAAKSKPAAVIAPVEITYIPLEDGDPHFTFWSRIKFKANVPVMVSNPSVIEAAKGNPWFSVGGKPPVERAAPVAPRDTSEDRGSMELSGGAKEVEVGDEAADVD